MNDNNSQISIINNGGNSSSKKLRNHNNHINHNNQGLRYPINRAKKQGNEIVTEAYHFNTKGDLILDIKNNQLLWKSKGEKSDKFLKKYGEINEFNFPKNEIKNVLISEKEDRDLLRFEVKNQKGTNGYIFSFQGNDSKKMRDKFADMLRTDFDTYYKNQFRVLPIEYQKRICLLLKNKYLSLLYRRLMACNNDIEKNWSFIKSRYPGEININLGKNKFQLSRDEELIMLTEKRYNKTKLLNSDSNLNKDYRDFLQKKRSDNENDYWKEFMDRQRINNTYIVGGYKPSIVVEKNDNEKQREDFFEELEKDKYYYDCYETNYLYHNDNMKNEQEKLIDQIKLLNDYSINKIKDINYVTNNSLGTNYYFNKKILKSKVNKKRSNQNLNIQNNDDMMMEVENIEIDLNNVSNKNKHSKEELENIINNMEKEFKKSKTDKDNSYYNTMKFINDENFKYYNKIKFEPSIIPPEKILFSLLSLIFLIKDLAFKQKTENIEKSRKPEDKLSPQKRHENIKLKLDHYNQEIRNFYEKYKGSREKIRKGDYDVSIIEIYDFLLENVTKTIEGLTIK